MYRHHRVRRKFRLDRVRPVPDPGVLRRAAQAGSSDLGAARHGSGSRRLRGGVPWLTRSRASRRSKTSAGCSNSCRPTTPRTAGRRHYRLRPPTGTRRLPMNDHRSAALLLLKSAALTVALSACTVGPDFVRPDMRSEEHTSELQSLMRISYAVFAFKKK